MLRFSWYAMLSNLCYKYLYKTNPDTFSRHLLDTCFVWIRDLLLFISCFTPIRRFLISVEADRVKEVGNCLYLPYSQITIIMSTALPIRSSHFIITISVIVDYRFRCATWLNEICKFGKFVVNYNRLKRT